MKIQMLKDISFAC